MYKRQPNLLPKSEAPLDALIRICSGVWYNHLRTGRISSHSRPSSVREMCIRDRDKAVRYVVYRFGNKEKVNLDDPSHIVAITRNPFYLSLIHI